MVGGTRWQARQFTPSPLSPQPSVPYGEVELGSEQSGSQTLPVVMVSVDSQSESQPLLAERLCPTVVSTFRGHTESRRGGGGGYGSSTLGISSSSSVKID